MLPNTLMVDTLLLLTCLYVIGASDFYIIGQRIDTLMVNFHTSLVDDTLLVNFCIIIG